MVFRIFISILLTWLGSILLGHAQSIKGYLLDKKTNKPIPSASVLLKSAEDKIIGFKPSDSNGHFSINASKASTGAYLEVNHLGYKKIIHKLTNFEEEVSLLMIPNSTLLDSIVVKSKPAIQRYGDTTAYNVEKFATGMDRSIGDVLKRMPGIEVSENGSIKYQGKPISNFYIDGDDLLDDRYSIGTRTIPHKMVEDIQVINNHEHLKVLKNKRFSDNVALNLVIKNDAKLKMTGEVKLGAGIPKLYDTEVNSILFNKKFKMLNVLQGNNVGKNLSSDFIGFNQASILAKLGQSPINNLLSLGTIGNPAINATYYLQNNQGSLNANNLVNLKKDWQLKSNIQTMYGGIKNNFKGTTKYLSSGSIIEMNEIQEAKTTDWLTSLRFTASKNTEKQYINNQMAFEYESEEGRADILSNDLRNHGQRDHKIRGFSNRFSYVPKIKKDHIIDFNWQMDYGNKPQTLTLIPGVFPNELNQGQAYDASIQYVEVPTLFSTANLGYRIPNKTIIQNYSIGALLDKQNLNSHMAISENGQQTNLLQDSMQNDMDWSRYQITARAQYEWIKKRFSIQLDLPLSLQYTSYHDDLFHIDENQNKLLFTPSLNFKYFIGTEDDLQFTASRGNTFGNIENVYRGVLIRNYRSLSNNIADINENRSNRFSLDYRLARTIKMMFFNAGISYSQSISSSMMADEITENSSQTQLIDRENQINTVNARVGFDKFIFSLASSLKLAANWSMTDYNHLFNQELLTYKQFNYGFNSSIETKIWKSLNLSYNGSFNLSDNRQVQTGPDQSRKTFHINQNLALPIYSFDALYLRFSARHQFVQQIGMNDINYVFLDAFARYRIKKLNTDIELNLQNLANIKTYETYLINANIEQHNQYQLRGRTAVLKAVFNFK